MASEAKREPRKLTFKIGDASGKNIIVSRPFEMDVDNDQLNSMLNQLVDGIKEGQRMAAARPDKLLGQEARRYTLYIKDDELDISRNIYTVAIRDAPPDILEKLRELYLKRFVEANETKEYTSEIYDEMAAYIKSKGLDGVEMTTAQWVDVCICHPLYAGVWDETQKRKFEKVALASIQRGIRNGLYKIKQIRMGRVSSGKRTDETRLIRKREIKP